MMDIFGLRGKKVLITGGSSGFGRSAAELLAQVGADVAISYSANDQKAQATLEALKPHGTDCFAIKADLADLAGCEETVKQAMDRWGRIDVLVHSAGIAANGKIPGNFDRVINVHLYSTHRLFGLVAPIMTSQQSGSIVVLTSIANNQGTANSYGAAMAGKLCYAMGMAKKLAPHNIRVNCIAPGTVFTEMLDPFIPAEVRRQRTEDSIPLWKNRQGIPQADQVGKVILFLASDLASHVTGEEIRVNGGQFIAL